jgi:hypothetical protein
VRPSSSLAVVLFAASLVSPAAAAPETHVGVITDTMCAADHAQMKNPPEHKCVRECVGDGKTYKYALRKGKQVYLLSDQETPATFAARKVKVTGRLYPKTGVIKVDRIEPAS